MRMAIAMTLAFLAMLAGQLPAAGEDATTAAPPAASKPATDEAAFVPPDGWRAKKRGKFTVYCRKQTAMGTRVPAETCYDEQGIRDMLAAQRDDRERVDQLRRICSSQATCGSN